MTCYSPSYNIFGGLYTEKVIFLPTFSTNSASPQCTFMRSPHREKVDSNALPVAIVTVTLVLLTRVGGLVVRSRHSITNPLRPTIAMILRIEVVQMLVSIGGHSNSHHTFHCIVLSVQLCQLSKIIVTNFQICELPSSIRGLPRDCAIACHKSSVTERFGEYWVT